MKGISCCGDCVYYNWKKHKCPRCVDEGDAKDNFYADCPLPDVEQVVHGRWVKARGRWATPGGDPVWECSECGKGRHVYGVEHGTYGEDVADGQWVSCPNCGAKMTGEEI
ncbi:MAG: hypothetical protein J6W84_03375 [Bacteroidales bacterium]|nr:hypothetical protein [Bacteroidales bacterium]